LAVPLLAALNAGIRSLTSEGPPPPEPGSTSDPTDTGTEGAPAVDDAPSGDP
jgi:hypothetical protein